MNKNKIWDITPLVTADFPLWPGSKPLQRHIVCDIEKGDVITSSNISSTAHLGAHADAPSHYAKDGLTIDECPLHYYLGLCQVIHPQVKHGELITKKNIDQKIVAPRVLFATSTFDYAKPFSEDFAAFDPDFFEFMAQNKVITIGIDAPSVDLFKNQALPCHQLAYKYEIALLENLDLDGVPEGLYELTALPLKIKGFDASPVRAILRGIEYPSASSP
ncbi:MAG: cyclase family protein [Parachlamydiaceae bacterium]|nr:cyclase family protein [Parachlamydiaceae bacterium]